jgi:BirA family transcriptional regulator, biotin operon repressor / biotin---[acetyl-CoA-carboxylase] ligase
VNIWDGYPISALQRRWRLPLLVVLDTVTSTNEIACRQAAAGAPAGSVFIADHQTAGRGQDGRIWYDTPGKSLLMSILMAAPAHVGELHVAAAAIVARSIESVCAATADVVLPNDVVCGRAKLAGVLIERPVGELCVVGIGVNVLQHSPDWPQELRGRVGSIYSCTGTVVNRSDLAGRIISGLRGECRSGVRARFKSTEHGHTVTLLSRRTVARTESDEHGSVWLRATREGDRNGEE